MTELDERPMGGFCALFYFRRVFTAESFRNICFRGFGPKRVGARLTGPSEIVCRRIRSGIGRGIRHLISAYAIPFPGNAPQIHRRIQVCKPASRRQAVRMTNRSGLNQGFDRYHPHTLT